MMTGIKWILRLFVVCIVIAVFSGGEASADCGGANEKTCNPVFNGGFRCNHGFSSENGLCKPCGRRDQLACAAARGSGKCRAGLVAVGRYCRGKGCGDVGQKSCDGKCDGKYVQENDQGLCEARGGSGEPRLQGLTFDCQEGFNFYRGPLIRRSTHSDYCQPCGGDGQIVCEAGIGRGFDRCDEGMDIVRHSGRDYCALGISGKTKGAMIAELHAYAENLLNIMGIADSAEDDEAASLELRAANNFVASKSQGKTIDEINISNFKFQKPAIDALAQRLSRTRFQTLTPDQTQMTAEDLDPPGNRPCGSETFNSWSVTSGGSISGVGDLDLGWIYRCGPRTPEDDSRGIAITSDSTSWGIGASVGVMGAVWVDEFDETNGNLHGYEMSMSALLDYMKIAKDLSKIADAIKSAATFSPDLSIAFWFDRTDNDRVGSFKGMSVRLSGGIGLDAGGTYHKAKIR